MTPTTASMRALGIVACVGCAIAAVGLAYLTWGSVYLIGFPDSHVTDYGRASEGPLGDVAWAQAGLGVVFLLLAFVPIGTKARVIGCGVAVVALISVAVIGQVGIPWYFGTHLGLPNGIGG